SAATAAVPSGVPPKDAAPAERAGGAAPPHPAQVPPQVSMASPPEETAAPRPAFGASAKAAVSSPTSRAAGRLGVAAPLRSSFGADTGIDSYRRVRRSLLAEGRLPRAASVRA